MSELKALVDALRLLSDSELRELISIRQVNVIHLSDFYELAESLNSHKSYSNFVGSLSSTQLDTLAKLVRSEPVSEPDINSLSKLQLVYKTAEGYKVFDALITALREVRGFTRSIPIIAEELSEPDLHEVDRNCGLSLFDTLMALNELVFDLEQHLVREVGKGGVGLPDVKRLSGTLGKSNEQVKWLHQLAGEIGLTEITDSRHKLTPYSLEWIQLDAKTRSTRLVENLVSLLGTATVSELSKVAPGTELRAWFASNFPLADTGSESRIQKILSKAENFGLAFGGFTSSWFAEAIASGGQVPKSFLEHLPETQNRIIIQADLSIVAPGPLPLTLEAKLRKFATCESIGLASTFRLSELSVCHGIEIGLSIEEIRSTLESASGGKIPQPVEYLLNQVTLKFGKLRISGQENNDHRSVVDSEDLVLLTEIGNDSRLRPYNFTRVHATRLASRFEPSVIYFGLREAGFLAIRVDALGKVVSPLETARNVEVIDSGILSPIDRLIQKLRIADTSQITVVGDEVLARQVQLAIRNKAKLSIEAKLADGSTATFILEPSSIANGRLRGKDKKAGIERTLPLTTITSITLA